MRRLQGDPRRGRVACALAERTFVEVADLTPIVGTDAYPVDLAMNADRSRFWLATSDDRVYVSHDVGLTWQLALDGPKRQRQTLPAEQLRITASPLDPDVLFVTTADGHLWAYREPMTDASP